jgi:threonine/homoserine/homoserine lactone efflux protein
MDAALVPTNFALGVALSAAPGALNVETLRRGLVASAFAVWGRQWLRPAALRVINVGCAVLLVAWGVQLVGHGAGRLVA